MKAKHRMWIGGLAVLGFAALAVPNCSAQCGMGPAIRLHSSLRPRMGDAQLRPVAFGDRSEERERHGDRDPIVGFWHVTFTAKTMNGTAIPETVIDNALVVWHSDGTEIMNSGRPPQDGNFCLGVWEQTGPSTYKLNHFALGNEYTPGTPPGVVGDPAGPTRFVETARVASDGNHYSGTFTLTSHDASGQPTNPTFTGVITATRISLDTTVADIL